MGRTWCTSTSEQVRNNNRLAHPGVRRTLSLRHQPRIIAGRLERKGMRSFSCALHSPSLTCCAGRLERKGMRSTSSCALHLYPPPLLLAAFPPPLPISPLLPSQFSIFFPSPSLPTPTPTFYLSPRLHPVSLLRGRVTPPLGPNRSGGQPAPYRSVTPTPTPTR